MLLSGYQLDIEWEDRDVNFGHISARLRARPLPQGSLLVLPEMFASGFSMSVSVAADGEGQEIQSFVSELAREHRIYVAAGVARQLGNGKGANEALICNPDGEEIVRYRKVFPFTLGAEHESYEPGNSVVTFEWGGFTIAPFICYDLRFPELFRQGVDMGANLFLVMANWPEKRSDHWVTLLKARAIENQAFVAGVNRCGWDPHHSYDGRSLIIDPLGNTLADAGSSDALFQADIDPQAAIEWRENFPALTDRKYLPKTSV